MTENNTDSNASSVFRLTGLSVDIVKSVGEKMDVTVILLSPFLNLEMDSGGKSC
jgi:hypothetical protein